MPELRGDEDRIVTLGDQEAGERMRSAWNVTSSNPGPRAGFLEPPPTEVAVTDGPSRRCREYQIGVMRELRSKPAPAQLAAQA